MKRSERKAVVHSIVKPYLTSKKDDSILGQYERVSPGPDGRIRTVLSPVVTETGRLASGESFIDPHSSNLQNISKTQGYLDELYRVRDVFIADEGFTLLASDFDKAEAVVAAFESEDWDFYQKIITGEDTHVWLASIAFHSGNQKAVTKQQRQITKNVYYASLFQAGVPTITRTINRQTSLTGIKLTESDVETVRSTLLEVTKLEEWWDRVWDELMDPDLYGGVRWLENCLGFRRMFYNPSTYKARLEAINFIPQSTVASRTDEVMSRWDEELEEPGRAELLLQVHDELLTQVRTEDVPYYASALHDLMTETFESRGREVYIPAGLDVGHRWGTFRGPDDEPLDPDNELGRLTSYEVAA